jgi:hypothetical protein
LGETLKYFDRAAKTDVYYKAQLIAAGWQKEAKLLAAGSLKTYSR